MHVRDAYGLCGSDAERDKAVRGLAQGIGKQCVANAARASGPAPGAAAGADRYGGTMNYLLQCRQQAEQCIREGFSPAAQDAGELAAAWFRHAGVSYMDAMRGNDMLPCHEPMSTVLYSATGDLADALGGEVVWAVTRETRPTQTTPAPDDAGDHPGI